MRNGLLLSLLLLLSTPASAREYDIYGLYGFDHAVMPSRWNPVTLFVSGLPNDSGVVTFTIRSTLDPASRPEPTVYAISLPAYARPDGSAVIRAVVPVGSIPLPLKVTAGDGDGTGEWEIPLLQWNAPDFLVVGLAEPDEVRLPGSEGARIALPVMETLPDTSLGYTAADRIVLGEAPFERATTGQIRALRNYLARETTLPVPTMDDRNRVTEAVNGVLLSQPIYRFPSRWMMAGIFAAYVLALIAFGRTGSRAVFVLVPAGLSLLFLLVYAIIDRPPAEALIEVQQVSAVAGEPGALLRRDILSMTIRGGIREINVPGEAAVLPKRGRITSVDGGRYVLDSDRWSSTHFATVELTVNPWIPEEPFRPEADRRETVIARIDGSTVEYLEGGERGDDPAADRILDRLKNEGLVCVVAVSPAVVEPVEPVSEVDLHAVRAVSVLYTAPGGTR